MANPRKFSEKIAMHTHRQAEETARFEQIMKEVSVATARIHSSSSSAEAAKKMAAAVATTTTMAEVEVVEKPARNVNQLRIVAPGQQQQLGVFRGGSLPNVAAPVAEGSTPTSTETSPTRQEVAGEVCKPDEAPPHAPLVSMTAHAHQRESRTRSPGGPIRRPQDRKHDTSPYSSGGGSAFLSPPPDSAWRRTHSDPALHQTTADGMSTAGGGGAGGDLLANSSSWMQAALNGPSSFHDHLLQHDAAGVGGGGGGGMVARRPRSSCDVPRVPGINIFYSEHEPGTIAIPIGNNTGSLPDLTSVHFPSPLHTPLDPDQDNQQQQQGSSPYSSSPVNTSPSTLSPTSVPPEARIQGRFQFTAPSIANQNHLSVPVNSRFLHHNKGVTLDNTNAFTSHNDPQQQQQQQQDFAQMHRIYQQHHQHQQQVPPTSSSPTTLQQQAAGYRSPRPSPQSSPSLGGRHSAPCSPGAPSPLSPLPGEYQVYNQHQATQLQQHFEQISMDWAQLVASLVESGCTWSAQVQMDAPVTSFMPQAAGNNAPHQPQSSMSMGMENAGDAGYFSTSPSQLVYQTAPASLHTTPNTPTSIPDIILTDFSAEDIARQDLSLTKQIENELFGTDALREGLEPLDIDSLQLLTHSDINLIADGVEDHFRLDRS